MKLLLINTPVNQQDAYGKFSGLYNDTKMVPTGLGYLASYVRKAGVEVKLLDQYAECLPLEDVYRLIDAFAPDLIGYGATTPNYFAAINFVRAIKKGFPHIKSVMGGNHPSILPEETLREDAVDFVIRDEGEYPLLNLCEAIANKSKEFVHIDGLSFKNSSGLFHNRRGANVDLDTIPFPAYDLMPMQLYSSPSMTKFASPVYQMLASRGCPFSCTYCINAEMNVAARYRRRSVKLVVDEMELLVAEFGAKQIHFWDPIFPLGRKHALEFCKEITGRGLQKRVVWSSSTRAELLNEEIVEAMVHAGCKVLGFGLESGVPELLRSVNKKFDLGKVREVCKIARGKGLIVAASFILGFPGETKEMTQQTIDFAKSLDIHYAQFSIMVPYPGTPLFKELKEQGEILPMHENDFKRYNQSVGLTDLEPVYVPKGRDAFELKKMQRQAYKQFYLRPRMLLLHFPHIKLFKIIGLIKSLLAVLKLIRV